MLAVSLALLLAAPASAPAGPPAYAVLAGRAPGDDSSEALAAVPALVAALEARGVSVTRGPSFWLSLGSKLREVGNDLPVGTERILDDAGQAFEEGRYDTAVKLATQAVGRLDHAQRSVVVEARERVARVLLGLSLLGAGGRQAEAHEDLLWALTREPKFAVDASRISPERRQPLESARLTLGAAPRATLTVTGPADANVYVDGLLSGQTPLTLDGVLHHDAWVWLELAGRRSLAHLVTVEGSAATVSIDLELEAALGMGLEEEPIFTVPYGDLETPRLLVRLASALGVRGAVVLSRCPAVGCWQVEAVADGRRISLHREVAAGAGPPVDEFARELLAEAGPSAGSAPPPSSSKLGEVAETPATAPEPPVAAAAKPAPVAAVEAAPGQAQAWPWVVGAVAVVAVGAGIGLYFALRPASGPSFDASVYSSQGSP